jgi:hypothetical protein
MAPWSDCSPAAGIAKAKAAGVYKGRPASIDVTKVLPIDLPR